MSSTLSFTPLSGPSAWYGHSMAEEQSWQFQLTDQELEDLDKALHRVKDEGLVWQQIDRSSFPLPHLASKLQRVAEELENGTGLARLRGLPVAHYAEEDLRRIWYGIGCHLGTAVYQNSDGQMMRDIEDRQEDTDKLANHHLPTADGSGFVSSKARTLSNGALRFHTDRCDVVALLCVHQAAVGGLSQIASSVTIHNEILAQRPDLADCLYSPVIRSRFGEEKGGEHETYPLPVFGLRNGKFTSHYSRTYVEAAQKLSSVPRMSDLQWEALDLLQSTATRVCMEMKFQPGDMQFLNNHVIYHARSAFERPKEGAAGRKLMRLWLSMPNSRALPEDHKVLWRNVDAGAVRGGIAQPHDHKHFGHQAQEHQTQGHQTQGHQT
ncbi:TauD/TfdA family dioxygenase [Rhodovibrionaceae bacterium A322]